MVTMVGGAAAAALAAFTAVKVAYMRDPSSCGWKMSVLAGIGFYIGFVGTVLLPIDAANTVMNGEYSHPLLVIWRGLFWTTILFAFVILPVVNRTMRSGETSLCKRMHSAVRGHLKALLTWGVLILTGGIVVVVMERGGTIKGVQASLMAIGNTYGLIMLIVYLGDGLVDVPRRLWKESSLQYVLNRLYFRATQVDNDVYDALFELQDVAHQVDRILEHALGDERAELQKIQEDCKQYAMPSELRLSSSNGRENLAVNASLSEISHEAVVRIREQWLEASRKYMMAHAHWNALVRKVEWSEQWTQDGNARMPTFDIPHHEITAFEKVMKFYSYLLGCLEFIWQKYYRVCVKIL